MRAVPSPEEVALSPAPVAVISGGSQGIGLATARRLAAGGYRVLICGRDQSALERASAAIGRTCAAVALDMSSPGAGTALVNRAQAEFGRVDALVNNAAHGVAASIEDLSPQVFEVMVRTNILAVFETTQAAWPLFKRQGSGVMVNVSSISAFDPFPGLGAYGATKAWMNVFSHAMAQEGRVDNIRVYAVCPGAVETDMLRRVLPRYQGPRVVPDAVAGLIADLVTGESDEASGAAIRFEA